MENGFVTLEAGPPEKNLLCTIFLRDPSGGPLPKDFCLAYFQDGKFHGTGHRIGETFETEEVSGYHYVEGENGRVSVIKLRG